MAAARQNTSIKPTISIIPSGQLMTGSMNSPLEKPSPAGSSSSDLAPVRRSTRDIKRKKFDDEVLIESAVQISSKSTKKRRISGGDSKPGIGGFSDAKPELDATLPVMISVTTSTNHGSSSPAAEIILTPTVIPIPEPPKNIGVQALSPSLFPVPPLVNVVHQLQQPSNSKKKNRSSKKSTAATTGLTNEQLQEQVAALKDVGRWQPTDDLALITAVMQTSDLKAVYTGVKFTCKFTLAEIAERWYALLYDPMISKLAQEAMKQLPPDIALTILSNTLYSKNEERLLSTVLSNITPTMELFNDLLTKHADVFHPARTARSLYQHWMHMRQHRVLPDQKPVPLPQGDYVMNFSDLEENFSESDVQPIDPMTERELLLAERHLTKQIRQLENELPKWQVLVEYATGMAIPDFDSSTIALLRGRLVRYLMRSKEVTLGRSAAGYPVDIDLSLEGPAFKVSRKQATIKLRATGEFYMVNEGKRPMFIDGKPLLPGSKAKLNDSVVIEVACLRFLFLVNQDLINTMRADATKTTIS